MNANTNGHLLAATLLAATCTAQLPQLDWRIEPNPPSRAARTLTWFEPTGSFVLFGGSAYGQASSWMGDTWTLRNEGANAPTFGRLVYDAARAEALYLQPSAMFAWDGSTWSTRSVAGLPTPCRAQPVYDEANQRVLVLNPLLGVNNGPADDGLYEYRGQDWQRVDDTAPVGLSPEDATFDASNQRWLAFENADQSNTWLLENTVWTRLQAGLPPARVDSAMAYDEARRRLVLFAGRQYIFSITDLQEAHHGAWQERIPDSGSGDRRADHTLVYDPAAGGTVMYGGDFPPNPAAYYWDGSTFTVPEHALQPPARYRHAACYDTTRQHMLVFGGEVDGTIVSDMWALDTNGWTEIAAPGPSARQRAGMCYDPSRDRVVLFGGFDGSAHLAETWEFDGSDWTLQNTGVAPSPREGCALVYDPDLQRCVLFGGFDDATDHVDTWLYDGTTWQPLNTAHHPDTGMRIAATHDPHRRETVVFGGGDGQDRFSGSLWRLQQVQLAQWQSVGTGCDAGNGVLELVATSAPAIDSHVGFELRNTPASFVALPIAWVGFDELPAPIALTPLNAPNCFVRATADVAVPMLAMGERASGGFTLPDTPTAIGVELFLQAAVWDFASATVGTANLLAGVVGAP